MIVGGNIDGFTRVMTTAIALETSKGDLPLALALGLMLLGVVLSAQRGDRPGAALAHDHGAGEDGQVEGGMSAILPSGAHGSEAAGGSP